MKHVRGQGPDQKLVWKDILKTTYVWMDWFSIPQRGIDDTKVVDIEFAVRSIPAYVEKADFVHIFSKNKSQALGHS